MKKKQLEQLTLITEQAKYPRRGEGKRSKISEADQIKGTMFDLERPVESNLFEGDEK